MQRPIHIATVVHELERHNLLPAIVFRSSRNQCDVDAERSATNERLHLSPTRQRELRERVKEIVRSYEMDEALITTHPQYRALITTGIGAHHAGQLLMWRLMLEELMASGLLRILVATGTVAAGVDFPARTVVITAHSRRGAEGFVSLTAAEFQQMSGRAGRRGKDTVGFCMAAPSAFCDARTLLKISKKPAEPLVSAYFPSPSTVLNLLRYRTVDGLEYAVERSLASYIDRENAKKQVEASSNLEKDLPEEVRSTLRLALQGDEKANIALSQMSVSKTDRKLIKRIRRLRREAKDLENRQLQLLDSALRGLRALGYLEELNLSEKGYWASNLCTSLVIELGEIIQSGMLDGISLESLVGIIAAISGDQHRQYMATKTPPLEGDIVARLQEIVSRVQEHSMPGVLEDRKVLTDAAHTAISWYRAEEWQQFRGILVLSGVAEGDAARLITQTAEHLNQLVRLYQSHRDLALIAEEAKHRLLRPPLTEVMNLEGF